MIEEAVYNRTTAHALWNESEKDKGADVRLPKVAFCEEKCRLLRAFVRAISELNRIHTRQTKAAIEGDPNFYRFEMLIHRAQQKKEYAKCTWISHVAAHRCHEGNLELSY